MKRTIKGLSLLLALCMLLSVSAYASGEPSAEPTGEVPAGPAAVTVMAPDPVVDMPITARTIDVNSLPPTRYSTLTGFTGRDTGWITVGKETGAPETVVLNETVTGPAYTAVYANGEKADATVTGTVVLTDDTDGRMASDFTGQGAALVAHDGAGMTVQNATVFTKGFARDGLVVSDGADVTVQNSSITVLGADPLTQAWDGYANSADQSVMLSPPWVLGITGGARAVNMLGVSPTLSLVDSQVTAGGWGVLSTDAGQDMTVNAVDSDLSILPAADGNGMDSGWRVFGYDPNAFGSGYGSYYTGGASQFYHGAVIDGVTYGAVITGGRTGRYGSSNGAIALTDAQGQTLGTVQGQGYPSRIHGVFGFMMHGDLTDGLYVEDGTEVDTAEATVLYKAGNGSFFFDDAHLTPGSGILFQMMDNDDDARIGQAEDKSFAPAYDEGKLAGASGEPAPVGFPGVSYEYASVPGGEDVAVTYANGDYAGSIYNGTGYYGQAGDSLTVTLDQGAALTGDISLTSTVKGLPYSPEALDGIAGYGGDIQYVLLDEQGQPVADDGDAAYIQITGYTMNEYFLQGHVQNMPHYNGAANLAVDVEDGASWTVTGVSILTGLHIAKGGTVTGAITVNPDGTLTLTPSDETIPAGLYGVDGAFSEEAVAAFAAARLPDPDDALVLCKTGSGSFDFDSAMLTPESGVLFLMMDGGSWTGDGASASFTRGFYRGSIYNASAGSDLTVTVGDSGVLLGGATIIPSLTDQSHGTLAVEVKTGGTWVVSEESVLTSLNVEAGGTVIGELTENGDGTLTVHPCGFTVSAGAYDGAPAETTDQASGEPAIELPTAPSGDFILPVPDTLSGESSDEPTGEPTEEPVAPVSGEPTDEPTDEPTEEPAAVASEEPTDEPTEEPVAAASEEPTDEPTEEPATVASEEPTDEPTEEPAAVASEEPTDEPAEEPAAPASGDPTDEPSGEPSDDPSGEPSGEPSGDPSGEPTPQPSAMPTGRTNSPSEMTGLLALLSLFAAG